MTDTEHFVETEYKVFHHFDNVKVFTPEEIELANKEETDRNAAAMKQILDDGFIAFPIFHRDTKGVLQELTAYLPPTFVPSNSEGFLETHGMNYNIYVPSYKRPNSLTAKMLDAFGAKNWYLAIDPDQYLAYKEVWGTDRLIIRDIRFRDPSMVDLGSSLKRPNKMSGTAGIYNNLLALSRSLGEEKYWTLDDDFLSLAMKARKGDFDVAPDEVYDKDNYYRCSRIKEEYGFNFSKFMLGMETVGSAVRNHGFIGLERFGTVFSLCVKYKWGTRVYSYYLTDNRTQPTHRGSMNNDVIASLEQSKRQMPPALLEVISYNSMQTQSDEGGLSSQYKYLGTLEKGKVLVKYAPNFAKITERYSRIHHTVDFNRYNKIRTVGTPINDSFRGYYKATD
jgi:hypothetical protein